MKTKGRGRKRASTEPSPSPLSTEAASKVTSRGPVECASPLTQNSSGKYVPNFSKKTKTSHNSTLVGAVGLSQSLDTVSTSQPVNVASTQSPQETDTLDVTVPELSNVPDPNTAFIQLTSPLEPNIIPMEPQELSNVPVELSNVPHDVDQSIIPIKLPNVPIEQPHVPIELPNVPIEQPHVPIELPNVPIEQPNVPIEQSNVPIEQPHVPIELPNVPIELPNVPIELPNVPIEQSNVPIELPNVPIELPNVPIELPNVPIEQPNVPIELSNVPIELPNAPIKLPDVPIEPPNVPIELPDVPIEQPNVPIEVLSDVPIEQPNVSIELPDVPIEQPNIPIELPDVPIEQPNVPIEQPNVPIELPNILIKVPSIPNEPFDISNEQPPNVPVEEPNVHISIGEPLCKDSSIKDQYNSTLCEVTDSIPSPGNLVMDQVMEDKEANDGCCHGGGYHDCCLGDGYHDDSNHSISSSGVLPGIVKTDQEKHGALESKQLAINQGDVTSVSLSLNSNQDHVTTVGEDGVGEIALQQLNDSLTLQEIDSMYLDMDEFDLLPTGPPAINDKLAYLPNKQINNDTRPVIHELDTSSFNHTKSVTWADQRNIRKDHVANGLPTQTARGSELMHQPLPQDQTATLQGLVNELSLLNQQIIQLRKNMCGENTAVTQWSNHRMYN